MHDDNYASQLEVLSERQRNIIRFIESFLEGNGYPPTIREIGEACNIKSTSVVNYNLNKLADLDWLERDNEKSRGIRLTRPRSTADAVKVTALHEAELAHVPLFGRIAAGEAIEVPSDVGHTFDPDMDTVSVPREMLGRLQEEGVFALRVRGRSMIDALIDDGDIVILRATQRCQNGDMVAAWLPERGETTLKAFYDEGSLIRLQPRNPAFEPIVVHPNNCQIKGVVLGVLRTVQH